MANTLYYWTACRSYWGRAIGLVLTLDEAGAGYVIQDPDQAPAGRFTFPTITLDSGETMGQVPAILNVLGARFGLTGESEAQRNLCQQTVLDWDDVFAEAQSGKFTKDPARAAKWFELLDAQLAGRDFMVSDVPTVADFHAVFATEWVFKSHAADAYDDFPRLAQWWRDICAHPPVLKMRNSGVPMIP